MQPKFDTLKSASKNQFYTTSSFGKQTQPQLYESKRSIRRVDLNQNPVINLEHVNQLPLNTYATWKKTYYEPTYFTHQTPSKSPYTFKKQLNNNNNDDDDSKREKKTDENENKLIVVNPNPNPNLDITSINMSGSQIMMSNVAGSRKPVTGFSSFV